MRWSWLVGALGLAVAVGGVPGRAAVQDPSAPKLDFPVPTEQRKIAPGSSGEFVRAGVLLEVHAVDQHRARVGIAGVEAILQANTPRLLEVGEDRVCTLLYFGPIGSRGLFALGCEAATPELRRAARRQAEAAAAAESAPSPLELVTRTPRGELTNPYRGDVGAAAEGHKYFLGYSCNGCHGGTGGGGMGPPLSNRVWVYGCDDDTLFRLVTLGSEGLQAQGYSRRGRENVVGPMPPFGELIETADELWKILAFVQSLGGYEADRCGADNGKR